MAATPLQLANAYATLANSGFLMRPHIVRNIFEPLTPDRAPAVADLDAAVVVQSFERPEIKPPARDAAGDHASRSSPA